MASRIHVAVLVVDDDDALCRRIHDALSQARFEAVTFGRAADALTHIGNLCSGRGPRSSPADGSAANRTPAATAGVTTAGIWRYAVALVDLSLPDAAGPALISDIRRISPPTRVLAMAAFPEAAEVLAAFRAGAADVLEKPIQAETLIAAVERQLSIAGVMAKDEAEFNRRLGARLRSIRARAERTLLDVADLAGITSAQLSQIELGKNATSTWTLARICAALRVPPATIFDELPPP